MKRKFRFKALALALAVAIPSLVLAENLGEAGSSERVPFIGTQENCGGPITELDGTCYRMCHTDTYFFWIKVWEGKTDKKDC